MLDPDFHISTPRLDISYFDASNDVQCDFFVSLINSPEMLHLSNARPNPIPDRATARQILLPMSDKLEATGYGRYIVSLRDPDSNTDVPFSQSAHNREYIGYVTMMLGRFPRSPSVPDLGFAFMACHHGKGYATEAALALMEYRKTKGQTAFAGYTASDNERSNRLFERMGFEDRGVREVTGIVGTGAPFMVKVWTVGLEGDLGEYGI